MAQHKEIAAKVDDLIVVVGHLAGVQTNNPQVHFKVRLALTQAQQQLVGMRRWKWMNSTGILHWSANQSTINMYSASAGKYSAFGGFLWLSIDDHWSLHEMTGQRYNELSIVTSTSQRPTDYWRFGEASLKLWPIPSEADSAAFGFRKRAGFVEANGDVIIPKAYHWNVLLPLATRYVWKMSNDDRAQLPDREWDRSLAGMLEDDAGHAADQSDMRAWNPQQTKMRPFEQEDNYVGFYSTGNLPP